MELIKQLEGIVRAHSAEAPRNKSFWNSFEKLDELNLEEFMILCAASPRRIGRVKKVFSESENQILDAIHPTLKTQTIGNLGRVLLVALKKDSNSIIEIITRGGDDEQAAAIIALNLREDGALYKNNVVHACRTNSTIVHSAVSQNNPYAAQYFDDQEFKQLTIKTIFLGLDFEQISGLEERFTGALGKSLTDFFDERKAAGRWLPDSVIEFMNKKGLIK